MLIAFCYNTPNYFYTYPFIFQKRVGGRLQKLKSSNKGVNLANVIGSAGKGRLTDSKKDVLQNYYGLAVRENLYDVSEMKSIEATLYHVASTDEKICIYFQEY